MQQRFESCLCAEQKTFEDNCLLEVPGQYWTKIDQNVFF